MMSKCRSIVYNLLIFCISVICQRRLKGEVSFRGKFLSHLRDENELRVLPGRRLPAHIRFIIHTIRTRCAFIGPVTNAAQEKADFSTKKPPKKSFFIVRIILRLIKYSLISFTICWMRYVRFPPVGFRPQPRWSLLFRSMHAERRCF